MEPAKRIVINTFAQHIRSIVNICLSLYSTRLVLQALGQSDFGIYSLVAGVVAMLGFLTNAMVVTTQRQLSFYHGRGKLDDVRRMFSNSLLIHIVMGGLIALVLMAIEPLLFNGFLVIEPSRTEVASTVYLLVVLALLLTFLTAPYRGLFIARENIVYISIVDVCDGIIKLVAALWLLHYSADRLVAYAWIMAGIMAVNLLALVGWAQTHFEESLLWPRLSDVSKTSLKELTDFAGWTIYSLGCIIGRTQGVAVILNQFFGTLINAAYGIAQQVYGSVQFVAQSVINAMSPQLIKAEGAGDRQRMLTLAEQSSKYAFLLLSLVVVPLVFEMPSVLHIWLGDVPEHAVLLCQFILVASLCDQTTIGLGTANQAIGKIRNYSLVVNTIKLLTLPFIWLTLSASQSICLAMWCYLGFEFICAMVRLPFLKHTAGVSIHHFAKHVFVKVIPPTLIQIAICWIITGCMSEISIRFLFTIAVSVTAGLVAIWFGALEHDERVLAKKIIYRNRHE